jgi:hypothetical protein
VQIIKLLSQILQLIKQLSVNNLLAHNFLFESTVPLFKLAVNLLSLDQQLLTRLGQSLDLIVLQGEFLTENLDLLIF